MRGKPPGSHISLRMIEWTGDLPHEGDWLVSTRYRDGEPTGTCYRVVVCKLDPETGRGRIECIKGEVNEWAWETDPDVRVFGFHYIPAKRRAA